MSHHTLVSLASIVALGIGAQLLAWRLRIPSILILLIFGFLAGPVSGFLNPDELLGEVLLPLVSISVAIILFDGGMSLRFSELRESGKVTGYLVTVGALVTWVLLTVGAGTLLGFDWALATLFGAILVVTGPTVILPLLRHIRPSRRVGNILKWEGIVIDPIGAILAVLVFEAVFLSQTEATGMHVLEALGRTVLIGGLTGFVGAALVLALLRRYLVPDYLQSSVTLAVLVGAFTVSNLYAEESGLLAVTLMGIMMANQNWVSIRHIQDFKENLQALLIAFLFITLAARLSLQDLSYVDWRAFVFLAFAIVLVRPVAVYLSSLRSTLSNNERILLAGIAPRGIVAAAVSSVFALRLQEVGYADAVRLVPLTFFAIIGTVAVYGLGASPLARRLQLSMANPQGLLVVGAHQWARKLAAFLAEQGYPVQMVDTNSINVSRARLDGLRASVANVLSEHGLESVDFHGIGKMLALTSNDEVNSLAVLHLIGLFGREHVYQLPFQEKNREVRDAVPKHLRGRALFGEEATFGRISEMINNGAEFKSTRITAEFTDEDYQAMYGDLALRMFVANEKGQLQVITMENRKMRVRAGQTLISLIGRRPTRPEASSGTAGRLTAG